MELGQRVMSDEIAKEDDMAGNGFVHLELNAPDFAKAKAFYSGMFGWEFTDMDMGPAGVYSTFKPADGPGGGMYSAGNMPSGWLAYVGVADIHASTAKAKELGAKVHMDSQEIPNVGWMTIMEDPTGCRVAMFQPK
jgi:predicted enzyme related to lactoylglutathione lyase